MSKKEEQIDSASKKTDDKDKKEEKTKVEKDEKGKPLTEEDIALIKRYGKGPYHESLKKTEDEIKLKNTTIQGLCGVKESDTGLALPASWNLQADAMMIK